jgi:hypothetical protein
LIFHAISDEVWEKQGRLDDNGKKETTVEEHTIKEEVAT